VKSGLAKPYSRLAGGTKGWSGAEPGTNVDVEAAMGQLDDAVVVITGASAGIGRATARELLGAGARVVLGARRSERLAEVEQEAPDRVATLEMDVRNPEDANRLAALAIERFGRVDVLVANAGVLIQGRLLDLDEAAWERALDVNLTGVYRCLQVFGRRLIAQGRGGRLLVTSSIGGVRGGAFYGAYSATKFGVIGLAQSLAEELAPSGILVNCVCPGVVDTAMMEQLTQEQASFTGRSQGSLIAGTVERIPLGRYATPEEVADAFVYLASPLANYVTGQRIIVDGGFLVT